MTTGRPQIGLASTREVRERYIDSPDLARLERFADFQWQGFNEATSWDAPPQASAEAMRRLLDFTSGLDGLVVCHGSPRIGEEVFANSSRLAIVGELEGDRFAQRIDVGAAQARGVKAVDTTHGSSWPVSEWALGMMLIGLRNAGAHFRRIIAGSGWVDHSERSTDPVYAINEELTGKTVGLLGCGYIGRRLIELLAPFNCRIFAHDPYLPKEVASAIGVTLTSLENALSLPDLVVCLLPLTPATRGLLGRREISLLKPGAVFVNVSRGAVVQTDALVERLRFGDIVASLDVYDPEPMPADAPVRRMPNVFMTPHIAGTTERSRTRFFEEMVTELDRFFSGHETLHDLGARTLANRRGESPPPR